MLVHSTMLSCLRLPKGQTKGNGAQRLVQVPQAEPLCVCVCVCVCVCMTLPGPAAQSVLGFFQANNKASGYINQGPPGSVSENIIPYNITRTRHAGFSLSLPSFPNIQVGGEEC